MFYTNMTDFWLQFRHQTNQNKSNFERVNIVHFNDMHENTNNIDSFITARNEFYNSKPNDINLTLAAGDMFNRFPQNERVVSNFVKDYVDATATGNRDLEKGKRLSKSIKKYGINDKFIGTNVYYESDNPLKNQILSNKIIEKNGTKIGLIGLAPVDFKPRLKRKDNINIKTQNLEETIETIKQNVSDMESQGINKIVVLAHTGEFSGHEKNDKHDIDYYKKLSEIPGIDIIIGGHDHRKTDRWEKTNRNEPVKIVSTGASQNNKFDANLDTFGEISLVFNKQGILQKNICENKFLKTNDYPKTEYVEKFPKKLINFGKITEKTASIFWGIKNKIKSVFSKDN